MSAMHDTYEESMDTIAMNEAEMRGAAPLVRALQDRHPKPEWATFAELAAVTGGGRRIDLFAMNLYASKGFVRIAYEVKVTRSDFRRELDDHTKRAPWESRANECWFAAPRGVVPAAEVPEPWGLLERVDGAWKKTVRPKFRDVAPMEDGFAASLARRSADEPPTAPLDAWDMLGRRITASDLMRLAGKFGREIERRRSMEYSRAERMGDDSWAVRRRQEAERRGRLASVVEHRLECRTAEELYAWLSRGKNLNPDQVGRLRGLRAVLDELIGATDG